MPGEPFFLKPEDSPWSRKVNSDRPSTQEEDAGSRSSIKKQGRFSKEDEGGTVLGCGIPSGDPGQRRRDSKEISAPSILDAAAGQAAALGSLRGFIPSKQNRHYESSRERVGTRLGQ